MKFPKGNTALMLYGYAGFCVVNYLVSKATAGTLRNNNPLLKVNDALAKLNILSYVLPAPTAPLSLPPGMQPIQTPDVVVTG